MVTSSCECLEECYEELVAFVGKFENQPGALIAVLSKIQETLGFVPLDLQIKVAETLNVPVSQVSGVVSFYAFFSLKPKGQNHLALCMGTACYVRGAEKILGGIKKTIGLVPGDTTDDGKFSLEIVYCLGACGLSPVMRVNEDVHARLKKEKIPAILGKYL